MQLKAKHRKIAVGLGLGVLGSALIGGGIGLISEQSIPSSTTLPREQVEFESSSEFKGSLVAGASQLTLPSDEDGILPSTDAPQRLSGVSSGRRDPFSLPVVSAVPQATVAQTSAADPAAAEETPVPEGPSLLPSVGPAVSVVPLPAPPVLPPLPEFPATVASSADVVASPLELSNAVPGPVVVPQVPVAAQTSVADGIVITGVVQLGDRISAIVQVPNEGSRYAQVGDRVAGGQVLIKHIDMSNGQEPVVILEHGGRDYTRIVGGTSLVGLL